MQQNKPISEKELRIVEYLSNLADYPVLKKSELFVMPMYDGGMGSFTIFKSETETRENRKFGKQISEYEFIDDDNIPVIVSLNVDQNNNLFEVDIWKADYSPVINLKIP